MTFYKQLSMMALAAACFLLTGCNQYGTDLPEEYKEFWDYTFNGNYSVELTEKGVDNKGTEREQGYRRWNITYTDKRGNEHTAELSGSQLIDYDKEFYSYKTQEWFDVFEMDYFVTNQMANIAEQELWDEILSKYLDVEFVWDEFQHKGEECTLTLMISDTYYDTDENGFACAKQKLSPENGRNIAECDLVSLMQDEEFLLALSVSLKTGTDAALYQEKIVKIEEELLAYTGGVQNYRIGLVQRSDEEANNSTVLYDHQVFLGEEFVPDPSIEHDSVYQAMIRKYKEEYE